MKNKTIHSALFGVAIGDALGVPLEFRSREYLQAIPVTDMLAFGTHNQPIGTWSDDSSLTFCLAEMLTENYDLKNLANRFINWYEYGYWTASGEVFDIGIATSKAIYNLEQDINPIIAGGLAGLLYGFEAIPTKWINRLVRKDDIYDLCNRLETKLKQ